MNPFDGLISTAVKTQFKQAIDETIRGCEVPCRLYYPVTTYTGCTDCSTPISMMSPNPFIAGNKGKLTTSCSTCGGVGKIPIENYDSINLCVIWNYKKAREIVPGIVVAPDGDAQTFSKMSTIKAIKTCKYAIFNTDLETVNKHKFKRAGEPVPHGFGDDAYILTNWEIVE